VLGNDVPAGEHVEREQAVVGHHDVRLPGAVARGLGEALLAKRAAGRAHALARRHRHQAPRVLVHARVKLIPIAGLGLRGPLAQPRDLPAQPTRLAEPLGAATRTGPADVEEGVRLLGLRPIQLRQAQVVMAPLEHRECRLPSQPVRDRLGQPGKVLIDQLMLERQRGRGYHHRTVHQQRGHQVGQRLSRTRAGLDEQVLLLGDGRRDRPGHRLLAGPTGATRHRADGQGEKLLDRRRAAAGRSGHGL
jgi:hypothetical protein